MSYKSKGFNRMKKSKLAVVLVISVFVLPVQALACACCSDENEYGIAFRRPTEYERVMLGDMKFAPSATKFEGPASDVSPANYQLTGGLNGSIWKFNLREGSKTGTLTLTMPVKMLNYVVDTHDGEKSPGGGPLLYKEWRFEGRASATGFLRYGGSPNSFFLVFQGRGNRCDNAEDFSHWRVEVKGPRTRYVLFGELARTTAQASDH